MGKIDAKELSWMLSSICEELGMKNIVGLQSRIDTDIMQMSLDVNHMIWQIMDLKGRIGDIDLGSNSCWRQIPDAVDLRKHRIMEELEDIHDKMYEICGILDPMMNKEYFRLQNARDDLP